MANDILVKVGADITNFSRAMASANRDLQQFSNANQQTFDAFKQTGAIVTGAGIALAGGLGFAVKTAADFESAMSHVQAISGASADDMVLLSEKAREMGASTKFSASESAEALSYMALAGWETEQMLAGIEPTLDLAAAAGMDLARTSDIVTDAMSMFAMEAEEAGRMADTLAAASSRTNTDVNQLGEALQYVGANAYAAGMDIEQTSAFLGVLADNGLKGSRAGTTLNAMLRDMRKNAEDGKLAIGDQTVALYDSEGQMRDMTKIMDEMIGATAHLTDEQRDQALASIFGQEALKGFNILANEGVGVVGDLEDELRSSEGAAKDMAAIMQDNLNGALTELSSAFEEIMIYLGSALIPVIKKVVGWLQLLADWFNSLSDRTKSTVAIILAIAAALMLLIGPILLLVGFIPSIIAGFAAFKTVVIAVGAALGGISAPVLIVIGLIGALIAALVVAWQKSEAFREGVTIAFEAVREVVMTVIGAVVDFVMEIWGGMVEWWQENNELITRVVEDGWNRLQAIIMAVTEFILPYIQDAWDSIVMYIQIAWEVIQTVVRVATEIIKGVITAWLQILDGDWTSAWNTIKQTFQNVWNIMKSFVSNVATIILNTIKDRFEQVKQNITNKITEAKNNLVSRFTEMVTNVVSKAQEIVSTARQKFEEVKQAIRDKLTEAVRIVGEKIGEMPGKVIEFVGDMVLAGGDLIQGLIDGITNMGKKAIEAITGVVNGVVEKAKSLLKIKSPSRVFKEIGEFTGEGLADGIMDSIRMVERASERMTSAIIPDEQNIDLSYATPSGIRSSLSSAVSGTVDVNTRDDRLIGALASIERRLGDLEVVMDGEQVGRIVRPHVNAGNALDANVRRYF